MRTELTVRAFDVELEPALSTADGSIDRRRGLAIRLRTDEDVGVGESTPLAGWTESLDACRDAVRTAGDAVAERAPWWIPLPADRPAARHGLQLAAMDLAARANDCPLAEYLGGSGYDREVAVNATVGDGDIDETVAAAERAVAAGFRTLKCKVGTRPAGDDVDRMCAVREAVGPDVELRVDANRAWSPREARQAMVGIEEADVSLVEEPLEAPTPEAIADLPTTAGVALDETLIGSGGLERWLGAIEAVVLKPMALGGVDRAVALAATARRADLATVISTTIDAVIARTAAVHLAAALPGGAAAGLATADRLVTDLADDPAPVRDGSVAVPTGPGIGTLGPWDLSAGRSIPHDSGD